MRKLATAAAAFSAAIFLAHYILPYNWLLISAAVAVALSFAGFLFKGKTRLRIFIAMTALAVGFAWSWTFTALFVTPAGNLHDQTATVTAVVVDYPTPRTRGYHVEVSVRQEGYPSIGARLRYFRTIELQPGDVVEFTARFSRTDGVDDSLRIDSMSARGSFLSALLVGDVEVIGTVGRWRHFPQRLSASVANMVDELFPDDVTPFLQALLSGRRAELSADTGLNSALAASGLAHVVAISGLHVTFLMGFLSVFINRRKRLFALVGIPVLVVFMAMTGFTPSVTRAGIMQVFIICAPIFRRESDSITSLSAALVLILALNPYSIGSIGLHLSFAATFGVINFADRINSAFTKVLDRTKFYTNGGRGASAARFVASSFATTFAAILFTGPLTAIHFNRISPIAPLANLLTIWAVSVAFTLGVVAVALGFIFFPLASIVAYPVAIAARYVIDIARALALIPFAALYVSNALVVIWLVYIYAMFITLPVMRARLRQYLNPACLAVIMLCVVLFVTPLTSAAPHTGGMSVTVLDVGQGQSVVITSGEHTAIVDCGSLSGERAGSIAHEFLMSQGRTTIDILILTHFHSDHVNGIEYLLSRTSVAALAIPDPESRISGTSRRIS